MRIALDTEDTGLDLFHGARPFFVTAYEEGGVQHWWEWSVDPLTREVLCNPNDLLDIQDMVNDAERIIGQNFKFDAAALGMLGVKTDWSKVDDTLIAGHLLASNKPHNLTDMAVQYLGVDIEPFEKRLEAVVKEARTIAKRDYPDWRIAKKAAPGMPSAKEKTWKFDTWLPLAIAEAEGFDDDHPFRSVLRDYANADSATTLALWHAQEALLTRQSLTAIYRERMRAVPAIAAVEQAGVTIHKGRAAGLKKQYLETSAKLHSECVALADGDIEKLPVNGVSNALREVVFGKFALPVKRRTKKGNASLDNTAIEGWLLELPEDSVPHRFLSRLVDYRKRATGLGFIEAYRRFWVPVSTAWARLHPSLNPTATDTLRFSSSNPNGQQISKRLIQEETSKHNARWMFGPAPGREWWALDYENIELRIPAYEAEEKELIVLFERSSEPPYYGSEHLLNFSAVYPDIWSEELKAVGVEKVGPHVKEKYADTWYRRCKNGDFAVGYGAVERADGWGTADKSFGRKGSHARLKSRFARKEALNQKWIAYAEKHGYVETLPDKTVDPKRGYPICCTRSEHGRILPTVPLNYHVQSTAMWCTMKSMIRCHEYLQTLPSHFMALQVHDEIVFDFPAGGAANLPKVERLKWLMEQSGDDINVPLKVAISYHPDNWQEAAELPRSKKNLAEEANTGWRTAQDADRNGVAEGRKALQVLGNGHTSQGGSGNRRLPILRQGREVLNSA